MLERSLRRLSAKGGSGQAWRDNLELFAPAAVCAFLGAAFLVGMQDLYLPSVEFETEKQEERRVGTLLAHADGYWYVLECKNARTFAPAAPNLYRGNRPGIPEEEPDDKTQLYIPEAGGERPDFDTNQYTDNILEEREKRVATIAGLAVSAIPDDQAGVVRILEPPTPFISTFARFLTNQDESLCLY